MTIGSLFSGIGGLELGLEMVGLGPVIWQAEADPFCLRVLSKRWPGVRRFIDVRLIDGDAARPDIVCGGFPCQDVSVAGKGEGLDGARSGLWSEYARIVRVLRPRIVFVENVAALVNRGLDRVLGDLAALGFDAQWDVFRASDVGAPHRRARLFLLAYADRQHLRIGEQWLPGRWAGAVRDEREAFIGYDGAPLPHAGEPLADAYLPRRKEWGGGDSDELATASGGSTAAVDVNGVGQADANGGRREVIGDAQPIWERASRDLAQRHGLAWGGFPPGPADIHGWDGPQPAVRRGADGTADRLDQLRALGNAVVPQVAALAFCTLVRRALS